MEPRQDQSPEFPTWDGEVDVSRPTKRGLIRQRYIDIPNSCAHLLCIVYWCASGLPWIRTVKVELATPRDLRLAVPWEWGVVLLKENYKTIALDGNNFGHTVYASHSAYLAERAVAKELERHRRANLRIE